jgi:hypothetical protein
MPESPWHTGFDDRLQPPRVGPREDGQAGAEASDIPPFALHDPHAP